MERHNVVLWVLTCLALELRDVRGELGGHVRPRRVVSDRIVSQSGEVRQVEASHERQTGGRMGHSSGLDQIEANAPKWRGSGREVAPKWGN